MSAITITIPGTLDLGLSPNRSRSHPGKRTRLKNELMDRAWLSTLAALDGGDPGPGPFTLHLTVGWEKGRKRWDDDNIIAAFKAGRDGIAAALGVDDRHITVGTVTQERDEAGLGYIAVTIQEAKA